jgi:hypothetical protein
MEKPTSQSSKKINYVLVFTILSVWVGACFYKKEFVPFDATHVAMLGVGQLGRGVIELVQSVGPNLGKRG